MRTTAFNAILILLIFASHLSGCSSTAVHPDNATTFDILFTDNVQQYLEERDRYLRDLQMRAGRLDDQILSSLTKLHAVKKQREDARKKRSESATELSALRKDMAQQQRNLERLMQENHRLQGEIEQTQKQRTAARQNQERDKEKLRRLSEDAQQLEEEVSVLDGAVQRNLRLRAEQTLEAK